MNILLVEYPGYGIYRGKPDSLTIEKDSLTVYDYLINKGIIKISNYQIVF